MLNTTLIYMLLSNAVTTRRDKSILFTRIAQISIIFACFSLYYNLYISLLLTGIGFFGGLFHTTSITHTYILFILILSILILSLTAFYPRRVWLKDMSSSINNKLFSKIFYYKTNIINKMGEQYRIIEYPLIIMFILSGATFLMSTSDLVSIFLSIELQSYGLYLLCSIYRNSERATSGGLTYFLLGGLSSCFILLAQSLLYANSGTTNLDSLYVITSISESPLNNDVIVWYKSNYVHLSLVILSVGFLFKVSAAPFHFWSPDVYDAIPTLVTTFVAIIAKISIFIFLLELVYYTGKWIYQSKFSWTNSLLISSFLSLIIGTIVGLSQFRIKRLFAYSTISHLGFILLALSINSIESIQAFLFYLMQYSISNLNAFIVLLSIGFFFYFYVSNNEETKNLTDKKNSPIQLISQLRGFFYLNPVLALSLAITLFSFVGVPPLIGFFAKQMVLSAALDNGFIFMALVAILTSVISAVYYLNVIKQIFFDKPEYKLSLTINNNDLKGMIKYDSLKEFFNLNNKSEANLGTSKQNPQTEDFKKSALFTSDAINTLKVDNISYDNANTKKVTFTIENIILSSSLTSLISVLTLIILFFLLIPNEWLKMTNILSIILFNV